MNGMRSGGWVCLVVLGLVLLAPVLTAARTLTVTPDDKSGIAGALAAASPGDVVLVGAGVYYENALFFPRDVALVGYTGVAEDVEIVTSGDVPVLLFGNAGPLTRVENLTVRSDSQGMIPAHRGAGAYMTGSAPTFINVIFEGLESSYGGAVYCAEGSAPTFLSCRFSSNFAQAVGGALACTGSSSPTFQECVFDDNRAGASGGTINAGLGSAPSLTACTIVRGEGVVGSGIATWDGGLVLDRVIVTDGIGGRAWDGDSGSAPEPNCSDLFGNAGGDWVGALAPYESINANISAAAEFCGAANPDSPYSLNASSPCALVGCGPIGAFGAGCDIVSEVGEGSLALPAVSRLHSNYPNPFNPRTTIMFDLKQPGPVELAVFDIGGRLVRKLVGESMPAGQHEAVWEGKDSAGRPAAGGVYFFRLKTKDTIDTKRMTLVK